jgi:hypothetical protein
MIGRIIEVIMSSITIHEIDPVLDRRLSAEAKERGMKKNLLVKELLASALGLAAQGKYTDDYRKFCGLWTREEAEEFESSVADNASIDPSDLH